MVSHSNTIRFEDAREVTGGVSEGDLTHHFLAEALARQCAPMWSTYARDDEVMDVLYHLKFMDTFKSYLVAELKRVADQRRRKDEEHKKELLRQELARKESLRREKERKEALKQAHAKRCAEATNVKMLSEDVEDEWPMLGSSERRVWRTFAHCWIKGNSQVVPGRASGIHSTDI